MSKNNKYFYGLDAYRGVAAILVIIGHVELIKKSNSLNNSFQEGFFLFHHGETAVTFFFTLSGFLITYLILEEEKLKGVLSIKQFYIRRVLRIWPVYYTMFFIGFIAFPYRLNLFSYWPNEIPHDSYLSSLMHYVLFVPNISPVSNPIGFQAWSIGVEEQFYLFWPLIFFFVKSSKNRLFILVFIYIMIPAIKFSPRYIDSEFLLLLKNYFVRARFENMALGGIFAIFLFKDKIWHNNRMMILGVLLLVVFLVVEVELPLKLHTIIYPLLFVNFILFTIKNTSSKSFLESSFLKYLGKISYGLYMYHIISIYFLINLFYHQGKPVLPNYFINQLLFQLSVIILSIFISSLSYYYLEKPFLKLKIIFSRL